SPLDPQDRDVDFAGIYLQDLVSLGDHWKILAGGRYEQADTRFARGGTVLNDATDQELSPRLGLIYKPNPDTTLYTSYTESFNPFVFRVRESGEPFEPETGEQIEAGIKRSLFDGRMTASLAGFEITKENVLTPDPDDPDRTIQTGEQRTRGIELDVTSDRIAGWQFVGTLSYLDAEVTEDNAIAEGNQLPNAPDWSGSLWAVHQFQQWPALELGGGLFFVDDRAGDIDNTFRADSYQRMDLFARYTLRENLRFQVNVNNVFDEEFIASSTGRTRVEPGAPLQAFARLEYRF
ncbi:MAG: TonB-dependent receptor, partial [Ectothiorhodospiraceae bacterium]